VYVAGTVLRRKEPFDDVERDDDGIPINESEEDFTPYNELVVIGQSPVQVAGRKSEWAGQAGDDVSVKPTSFGDVVDRPQGELERDYTIVSIPERPKNLTHTVEVVEPGPAPEDIFAADSPEPTGERAETPFVAA
jgi:hypothetical protein